MILIEVFTYIVIDSAIPMLIFIERKKMPNIIPFLVKQTQKQILKKSITHSTGLDDFLGIKPLNENEDIVIREYNRPNSPARKNVSLWSEQDYYNAVNSYGFSQNYMLQNMCNEYLRLRNSYQNF